MKIYENVFFYCFAIIAEDEENAFSKFSAINLKILVVTLSYDVPIMRNVSSN